MPNWSSRLYAEYLNPLRVSLSLSDISAVPNFIPPNGSSQSIVTVTLRNGYGALLGISAGTVVLATTAGTLGPLTDNGDGTYTATLTSSFSPEIAIISGTLDGNAFIDTANVAFFSVPTGGVRSRVLYGHPRLRRESSTRRDAIALAMQNREEGDQN